jgi:hypothetical protein
MIATIAGYADQGVTAIAMTAAPYTSTGRSRVWRAPDQPFP